MDIASITFLQEWTVRSVRKVGTEQTVQWSVLTLITTLVQTRATRLVLPTGPVRTVIGNSELLSNHFLEEVIFVRRTPCQRLIMSRYRCKEGHFGPKCRCERKPGRGECDNEGVLHCLGHWTGTNCDTCRPGYSGPQCLHQDEKSMDLKSLSS